MLASLRLPPSLIRIRRFRVEIIAQAKSGIRRDTVFAQGPQICTNASSVKESPA